MLILEIVNQDKNMKTKNIGYIKLNFENLPPSKFLTKLTIIKLETGTKKTKERHGNNKANQ